MVGAAKATGAIASRIQYELVSTVATGNTEIKAMSSDRRN